MRTFLRHALFWTLIYFLWTYMKSGGGHFNTYLLVNLLNVPIYMAAYYFLKHVQIPLFYNQKKIIRFALSLIVTSTIFYFFWRAMGVWWIDAMRGFKANRLFLSNADFLTQTVQFYSPAMALLAWETHQERIKELERVHQLEKEKMATELKYLKAQLNPHFLFNTLNNLYSYVVTGSPKAPDMILRLSGMLDYVLYKSQNKAVPLAEEIEAIHNFIGLEKNRYGDRLQVNFNITGNLDAQISPLLLLSLVENAFKHGASGDIETPKIKIDIKAETDAIHCVFWNTKSQHQGELNDAYKEGIGLSNIKRQLDLIYQDNHELRIADEEKTFTVNLLLKPLT